MLGAENPRYADLDKRYFIPYFSYSQLSTFMKCPHEFELTYLSGEFKMNGNKYTKLGNVLHDIFEAQGKQLISEGEPLTEGQAIKRFNKDFMKVLHEHKEYFEDKEDFKKMYKKGVEAIRNYYGMFSDSAPLYVEKQFKERIAEGLPPAKSFVDRIDGDPNDVSTWVITDYKTGSSPKSKAYLREDIQMGLYCAQIFAQYGEYPKAVQFVHPVPNKVQTAVHQGDGVYRFQGQREPVVTFSVADTIMIVRETLADIIEAKDEGNFPKKPESFKCGFCWHFQSGACKPWDKQQQGWNNV